MEANCQRPKLAPPNEAQNIYGVCSFRQKNGMAFVVKINLVEEHFATIYGDRYS